MTYRVILLSVALAVLLPAAASAQFTTFVQQAPKKDSVEAVIVAEKRARADSAVRATITDMRAWVDSAAGVAAPVTDTVTAPVTEPVPAAQQPERRATTRFSEGAVAPDTASILPLLAVLGLALLSIGIVLLAGRKGA